MIRYGVAAALARLADEMVAVALVLLVLDRTGDAALAGAAVAGYTLPAVLTGPVLGAWLSRLRRPALALLGNELVLAAVAAALPAVVGRAPGWAVVGLTAVAGATLPCTSGGYSGLVPRLAGGALAAANTVDAVTFNLAAIGGPALAGGLAATLGPAAAVDAVAGCAVLAALVTATLTPTPGEPAAGKPAVGHPTPGPPAGAAAASVLAVARAGVAHLARTPPLRAATVASAVSLGCVGLLVVAVPARVTQLGADRSAAGYVWAAIEVGAGLGTLLVSPRLRSIRPERVAIGSIAAYGAVLACWTAAGSLPVTLALAVLAGLVEGPTLPAVLAARQRYSPGPLLAQVAATGASLKIGAFALGSALGGVLTPALGPAGTLLLVAAGQFAAAGGGLVAGRSRAHQRR